MFLNGYGQMLISITKSKDVSKEQYERYSGTRSEMAKVD